MVGLAFQDHRFEEGEHQLDGGNVPWNTFAIWDVRSLSLVGFLPVSDGPVEGVQGGVEEVITISLLQSLRPETSRATLVRLPGSSNPWAADWNDPERIRWHQEKMASKVSRPLTQMKELNLKFGRVKHESEN